MSVIDASVAVKWFKDEPGSNLAHGLLEAHHGDLYVPDIFVVEVAATIVQIANANKAAREIANAGLFHLVDLIDKQSLLLERTSPGQTTDAAYLAMALGHPLKDCIYLALAIAMGRPLITADANFVRKARPVYAAIELLGESV